MNIILTTCKNRREHLAIALESWRACLPGWVPMVVAVDDPAAVDLTARIYLGLPWLAVPATHRGFSRLLAIRAGVMDLEPDVDRVVIFDADVVALLGTLSWLTGDLGGGFRFPSVSPGRAGFDDTGVLLTTAPVLRAAFNLLGDISDWEGYGWEDILLRYACWFVTGGVVSHAPACWAHIPHSDAGRLASYHGTRLADQARVNARRCQRDLERMAAIKGVDLRASTITSDCSCSLPRRPSGGPS